MQNPFASWSIYVSTACRRRQAGTFCRIELPQAKRSDGLVSGALIRLEPLGLDEGTPIFYLVLQPRLQHRGGSEFRFDVEYCQALDNGGRFLSPLDGVFPLSLYVRPPTLPSQYAKTQTH